MNIVLQNVSLSQRLHHVTLRIASGERVGLVGANQSGKTSLFHLLLGRVAPSSGTISLNDKPLTAAASQQAIRMVHADPSAQLVAASVYDELAFDLRTRQQSVAVIDRTVSRWLARCQLTDHARTHPFLLSAGEQQRLAVAAALISEPACLLCDEVTAMLDSYQRRDILQLLNQACQQQTMTLLAVTHRLQHLPDVDRLLVLHRGQLVQDGSFQASLQAIQQHPEWAIDVPLAWQLTRQYPRPNRTAATTTDTSGEQTPC